MNLLLWTPLAALQQISKCVAFKIVPDLVCEQIQIYVIVWAASICRAKDDAQSVVLPH